MNELSPDYRIWNDFQLGKNAALATDALESTHPIYSPVQTPAEANELFDVITYQKGSAVLRMLEHFLGADAFRSGLRTYMREFAERNAAGADLWRHLQQAADVPVEAIMKSWILQNGYPLISIAAAGNEGTALQVSQRRFFSSPGAAAEPQLWQVPLVIRYADDRGTHETRFLLTEREASVPLDVAGTLRWCYANASEIGFYRQHLQDELVDRLREHLHELAPSEQLGLLNDQWALTRNGTQTLTAFLDVLAAMATVNHYHVLREVLSHLHTLDLLIEDTGDEQARDSFRAWVGRTFREQLTELGFEPRAGESRLVTQQRISIVDAMLTLAEDAAAREQAEQWVEREAADPAAVDPNLAPLFISATARFGDAQRFRRYVDLYRQRREAGSAPQETERYLYSLVEFRPAESGLQHVGPDRRKGPAARSDRADPARDALSPAYAATGMAVYKRQLGGDHRAWSFLGSGADRSSGTPARIAACRTGVLRRTAGQRRRRPERGSCARNHGSAGRVCRAGQRRLARLVSLAAPKNDPRRPGTYERGYGRK